MFSSPLADTPIFEGQNPTEVISAFTNEPCKLCVYYLQNGKKNFRYFHVNSKEISDLMGGYSIVKFGRHWWI